MRLSEVDLSKLTKKELISIINRKNADYNDLLNWHEGTCKASVRLKQHVRDCLWKAIKLPSNPGWSDDNIIDGLSQWKDKTIELQSKRKERK